MLSCKDGCKSSPSSKPTPSTSLVRTFASLVPPLILELDLSFIFGFFSYSFSFTTGYTPPAGESYGGDYVPQLVYQIVTGSNSALKNNLKGFMIGNPVFSCQSWKQYGNTIQVELYYWHGRLLLFPGTHVFPALQHPPGFVPLNSFDTT